MKASWAKFKVVAVVLLAGVLPLLASLTARFVFGDAPRVQESLHAAVELGGSCIALAVAMLLLLRARHEETSPHLFWVAASLIAMGLVDGLHSVHGIALHSWQRHGATLLGGVLFAAVWLPLPRAVKRRKGLFLFMVAGLALALGLWWGSEGMPSTWDPVGLYTFPVQAVNALGGVGFLAAALFFCRRYLRQSQTEDLVFASLTVLFGMAGLLFGLAHTWAADWWVWHGARLLAYSIVLVAAYEMVVTLYRQIGEHAQELEGHVLARTAELVKANDALQTEIVERQRAEADVEQRSEEQARLNADLTRSSRATLNLMQDAVAAKQMLEQTNQNLRQEIAQRQQAEERVGAEKRISDSLIQSLPGIFYLFDANGRFLRWNANFERVTGYSAAELATLSPLDLFVGEERALIQRQIQAVFVDGQADAETNLFTKQGDRTPYYFTGLRIELDGQPCLLGVGLDLTSRRKAEAALHEAQSLRAEAEKLGKVGGWEFDTETKAVTWTEEVFHIHEVDLTYQPTVDAGINFYAPASRPIIARAVQRAIEQGEPFDVELEIVTAKGNRRHVHSIGRADPTRRTVLGFFQDITAQKHAEQEIRNLNAELEQRVHERTAQLETANKELEAFSYSVSHDLRAPLRAIDGYGRILLEDYESRLDPEGRRLLGVISGETRRMGQLIDDLLAFSQLSRRKLEASDIDMTAMARAIFDEQAGHAPQRVFRLELQPLPPANGDPAMIRVALGNLLSNAIKFTTPRNPAVIEIGGRQEDGQAVFYVKDNGVGFDMQYAHKLFGVFQRLHSTEEFEGTDVGLALVQRVIHRHGGRVWAEGKVDEGATFYFSLPDMREES